VLAAVSAAMRDLLRDRDLCGRFGGEEFALLLPRTAAAQALEITERIRHGVSQLAIPRDGTAAIRVTISVGIAVPDRARRTLDDLIAAADPRPLPGQAQRPRPRRHLRRHPVPQASRPLPLPRTSVLLG
jgi:diguanylate cyclase (GGDEF)-like protein